MVRKVVLSNRAKKDLRRIPAHIVTKLQDWTEDVEERGLEEVRRIPGYHDEPLHGNRKDQKSIRLSKAYRAIYRIIKDTIGFVLIEEATKHDY